MSLPPPPPLHAAKAALFSDLDGTLTPIRDRPGDVGPDPGRAATLAAASRALDGALAVVSGRVLSQLDHILDGQIRAIAAVHGLIRRSADGEMTTAAAAQALAGARAPFADFLAAHPALTAEDKGVSIALHFRADPEAGEACRAFVQGLAERLGLTTQAGDHVVELRAPGPDKGAAVRAFMAEPPFQGRVPVFLGDDLTDEHGFAEAERLGGWGVVVGPRRPTAARYALSDPAAVLAWIAAWRA